MYRLGATLVVVCISVAACSGGGSPAATTPAGSGRAATSVGPTVSGPPVVWVAGDLRSLGAGTIVVQEDGGQAVRLQRLAEGATRFYSKDGEDWRALLPGEVQGVDAGGAACVEALLDGRALVALNVYLGSGCGPG